MSDDLMSDQERRAALARLQADVERLRAQGDPVLAAGMARIVAILHETRQLLDPTYLTLTP